MLNTDTDMATYLIIFDLLIALHIVHAGADIFIWFSISFASYFFLRLYKQSNFWIVSNHFPAFLQLLQRHKHLYSVMYNVLKMTVFEYLTLSVSFFKETFRCCVSQNLASFRVRKGFSFPHCQKVLRTKQMFLLRISCKTNAQNLF